MNNRFGALGVGGLLVFSLFFPSLLNASRSFGNLSPLDGYSFIAQLYPSHRLFAITVDDEGQKVIGEINDMVDNPSTSLPRHSTNTHPKDTFRFVFSKEDTLGFTISVLENLLKWFNTKGLTLGFDWNNVDSVVFFYTGITVDLVEYMPLADYLKQLILRSDYCCERAKCEKRIFGIVTEVNRASDCTLTWYHSKGWGGDANLEPLGFGAVLHTEKYDCTTFIHHEPSGTGRAFRVKVSPAHVRGCTLVLIRDPFSYVKALTAETYAAAAIEDTLMFATSLSPLFSDLVPNLVITEEGSLYIVLPPGSIVEE